MINEVSTETAVLRKILELPHALMGGTRAMREAGQTFLPKFSAEDPADYTARLNMSFLFPGYERTVALLSGQVFDKPVTPEDETAEPPADVDMEGSNITRFSRHAFEQGLVDGSGFLLADVPPLPRDPETGEEIPTTAAQDRTDGRRPYMTAIGAENVLGIQFEGQRMVQFRYLETVTEQDPEDKYSTETIQQIRVLTPGAWALYRESGDGQETSWDLYASGTSPWRDVIPVAPYYFGRKVSKYTTRPPLTGLAELNQEHWISSSDQRNILHVGRVPLLFGKGLDQDESGKVIISPHNLLHSGREDGDLKYVEHTGAAMGEGWKDLDRIETRMELWGLALIMQQRSGNITATERAITSAQTSPFLNSCALEFQDALNTVDGYIAQIENREPYQYRVNTEFSMVLSSFSVSTVIEAFKTRLLDRTTAIQELKRRGEISEDADPVEIAAALEQDTRSTAGLGASILG